MPAPNTHPVEDTPGRIVAELLVTLGIARLPSGAGQLPVVYAEAAPDGVAVPAERYTITTTTPVPQGAYAYNGFTPYHVGLQVRADGPTEPAAYAMAARAHAALSAVRNADVTIAARVYRVYNLAHASGPARLGRTPGGNRYTYTHNYTAPVRRTPLP